MKKLFFLLTALLLVGANASFGQESAPKAGAGPVWIIELADTINPGSAEFLKSGLAKANAQDASLIIVELDTPGGLVSSMREIVRAIKASPAPVAVYVSPSGARATSAGAFILLAGHVAAMAPATHVGAASPVAGGGKDIQGAMAKKAKSDLSSLISSLAKERGRNPELAVSMVMEAKSFDVGTAKKENLIDLIAPGVGELLKALEGKVVATAAGQRKISTAGKSLLYHKPGFREKLLSFLANPNLAYIFLMIGMIGLYFEFSNPGAIVPGVVGGLAMVVAMFSMSTLPVSAVGLALLALGVVLFILEIKVTSWGMLSLGGAVSLVLGSLMLFDNDQDVIKISLSVLTPTVAAVVLFFGGLTFLAARAQLKKSITGGEGILGAKGVVFAPGKIRVLGEIWNAQGAEGLAKGEKVEVVAREGLTLSVKKFSA